jgi:hypothetical protein
MLHFSLLLEFLSHLQVAEYPKLLDVEGVPRKFKERVINLLPVDMPPEVTAHYLIGSESESYPMATNFHS